MAALHGPGRLAMTLCLVLAGAAALVGCDRREGETSVGQRLDAAIAKGEVKADQAASAAVRAYDQAKAGAQDLTREAAASTQSSAALISDKVADAAITTSVNAELSKDPALSALKIDVDTSAGHVRLSGTAPNAPARERATGLARSVKGVVDVENNLRIDAR